MSEARAGWHVGLATGEVETVRAERYRIESGALVLFNGLLADQRTVIVYADRRWVAVTPVEDGDA